MGVQYAVDCPHQVITLTWRLWVARDVDEWDLVPTIKFAIENYYNDLQLRYYGCRIRIAVEVISEKQVPHPPAGYDEFHLAPAGGGTQGGYTQGPPDPREKHTVTVDPVTPGFLDEHVVQHEFGHVLGIEDTTVGQNRLDWDRNGFRPEHRRIINEKLELGSELVNGAWTGFKGAAWCCRAIRDARTERDPGD
jgi:hypothetical protein